MADLIRRALTRRRFQRNKIIFEEADDTVVYLVKFGIGMTACLTALEIASLAILGTWNSEVFASITALSGIILGVFVGRKK
jgi:hypothetical protein